MIVDSVQRWRSRRASYRPAGEPIATSRYEVAQIPDDKTARAFVEAHHYSGSYPAARARFGLFCGAALVGVCVFSQPVRGDVLDVLPGNAGVELGRLVLLDEVPANGESWFVARAFELLRADFDGVLSFADPTRGHVGTVYQASNACYLGQAGRRTIRVFPDGSVLSARAISKVRAGERGWRYAAALLERYGAEPLRDPAGGRQWLATWLPRLTRTARHPGNHRYLWALDRRLRRALPESLPYPKLTGAA